MSFGDEMTSLLEDIDREKLRLRVACCRHSLARKSQQEDAKIGEEKNFGGGWKPATRPDVY